MPARKVLYLETGTHGGGSHESLLTLVMSLDQNRYRPHVVFLNHLPQVDRLRAAGIPCHVFRDWQYNDRINRPLHKAMLLADWGLGRVWGRGQEAWQKLIHFPAYRAFLALAREIKPDIIHLNNQVVRHYFGLLAAEKLGAPCVSHLRSWITRGLTPRMAARANQIARHYVTYARSLAEYWAQRGIDGKRISIIPNGMILNPVEGLDLRQRFGLPAGAGPLIGAVGYIRPNRTYDFLLDAWPQVLQKLPRARLLIVGTAEPGLREALAAQADRLGIADSVMLLDKDPEGSRIAASLDVLVLPYRIEPLGRVLLEGWQGRTPVVATRVGHIEDHLTHGENAMLADYREVDQLAGAIVAATEPETAARLAEGGWQTLNARFTAPAHGQAMMELYDRVLAGGGAS